MLPLALVAFVVSDPHVEIRDNPPAFTLEPGFIEAVPETPIIIVIDDAAPTDELALDIVRIGPLGKGRCKLTVTVDDRPRTLTAVAATLDSRKVGKQFASMPVHQRVPLPTGSAFVSIKAGEPMAIRIAVEPAPATGDIPLAPLEEDTPPTTAPPTTAPPTTTPPTTAPPTTTPPTTTTTTTPTPTAPTTTPTTTTPATTTSEVHTTVPTTTPKQESSLPKLYAEVHAGGSVVASGLQTFVPAGGVRILIGPRSLDAALGFAVDFDGQGAFLDEGRWDAATTRVRLEGLIGLGELIALGSDIGVAVGAGARITQHTANGNGISTTVIAIGGTLRVAPEATFEAGPGKFIVEVPIDVTLDLPDQRVTNFAPVAAGALLGYRLEL